ncbi:G5 domain-containing protein [Patescibacteria group bacterium]
MRIIAIILVLASLMYVSGFLTQNFVVGSEVLGAKTGAAEIVLESTVSMSTRTAFLQKEIKEYEEIPFRTIYENNDELELGEEEVVEEGVTGQREYTYLVTYWGDDVINKEWVSTEVTDPTPEKISRGTKVVWKTLSTPEYGEVGYWRKMHVFATKYDSSCLGCNHTTALGAPVQQGVCAVDPTVISMYTHFYVPGYGKCQALDVGGLIKGNRIDLAYENAYFATWGAEYVDIYLMDNVPSVEDLEEQ